MKRNKQARIVLKVMAVLIACLTLNATAKEVPAQLPAAATGNATEVSLAALFSDHIVLQRDMPIKIWGWSNVGGRVVVSLGGNSASAVSDATGKWMVTLSAMPAGGPYELVVRGAETITVKDVLIGEVWACKDTVEVWHDKVPEPVHVRFAWHRNPLHNLYNKEKLPAPPFRTDKINLSSIAKRKRR